ncbi:MAG: ATP-binding protein, partial [Bacteroidales bacterium]
KFSEEGEVRISYTIINNTIEFCVSDTGIGIAPHEMEFIFENFRQADEEANRKYGGAGIGLAVSKGLVEFLQGSIRVESQKNIGTKFFVIIPIH